MKDNKQEFINKFNNTNRHKYNTSKGEIGIAYSNGTKADLYNSFSHLLNNDKISADDLAYLGDKYGRFVGKNAAYGLANWAEKPDIEHRPKTNIDKQLGDFTINALSKVDNFKGINLTNEFPNTAGVFNHFVNKISLNRDYYNPDILSTIVHEGNHAIENNSDYSRGALDKLFGFTDLKRNTNAYEGVQQILGIERFKEYPYAPYNLKEIPAYALQSLMGPKPEPWHMINVNQDSRKLLRRIMKDTHQKYKDLGLSNVIQEGSMVNEPYKYNQKAVLPYKVPNIYSEVNKTFLDRIDALKKPEALRKNFQQQQNLQQPQSSQQQIQNPLIQQMMPQQQQGQQNQLQNQQHPQQQKPNSQFGQQQSQLGNLQPSSSPNLKRPLTPQQTLSPNSSPTKKILQTENAYQHEQQQNQNWNQEQEQNNVDQLINNQNQQQLARGGEVTKPRKLGLSHYLGNAHGKHEYKKGGRVSSLLRLMTEQRSPNSLLNYL